MKIAELNIGLSSNTIGGITPEKVATQLGKYGFGLITHRIAPSSCEDGGEDCFACKVILPQDWQDRLARVSNALGQDCIAVVGFIGHNPYDTFAPEFWISPELCKVNTSLYEITNSGEDTNEITIPLTKSEATLIRRVIDELDNSNGGRYAPSLEIEPILGGGQSVLGNDTIAKH